MPAHRRLSGLRSYLSGRAPPSAPGRAVLFGFGGLFAPGAPITPGVAGVLFWGFSPCCNSVGVGVFVCGLPSGTGCGTVVVFGPVVGVVEIGLAKQSGR